MVEKWKSFEHHKCTLYSGKYSQEFHSFCLENKIATPCNEGIIITEELAFVYMSFLADKISKNNEFEMITDVVKYNTLLLKNDHLLSRESNFNLDVARNNIELLIPNRLEHIPIESIIELRNQPRFSKCRKAYMKEIVKFIEVKENEQADNSFEKRLSCQKDFLKLCTKSFDMIASTTLFVASVLSAVNGGLYGFMATTAIAASFNEFRAIQSVSREMPEVFNRLNNNRLARKYVVKVKSLDGRQRLR